MASTAHVTSMIRMRKPIGFLGQLTNIDTNLRTEITWLFLPQALAMPFDSSVVSVYLSFQCECLHATVAFRELEAMAAFFTARWKGCATCAAARMMLPSGAFGIPRYPRWIPDDRPLGVL
ncbi:hypothetical protein [Bradyrhizobium diversitatis]|uniref:Uncharacterized protein n=1 Tax=Bradyrhizobium diversitatis TaxID=2755406 RepID=A0ABS0PAX4_9BRAD|nr:hypothetical protein [Bradyrhizobium diversitatis]MBH5390323.1 hypothetical protein [Bradyrhizobium diversitatis]